MTGLRRGLSASAAVILVVAVAMITLDLPAALSAGARRADVAVAASDLRVAQTEAARLSANVAILGQLRRTRRTKNAALARSIAPCRRVVNRSARSNTP